MAGRFRFKSIAAFLFAFLVLLALPAQNGEHIVAKGETLFSIAKANGLSLQEILDANHLTTKSTIKVGQSLVLPAKTKVGPGTSPAPSVSPQPVPSPVPSLEKYTVLKGDTLYGIARQNGVDLAILLKTNKLTEKSALKAGQILLIPQTVLIASSGTTPKPSPSPIPSPSPSLVPSPTPSPSPAASVSVDMNENTAQATDGTMLSTKPYTLGAKLSWPHPGERLVVEGKLPGLLIKASKGDEVKSISSGKVIYSNPHATFGYVVMVLGNNGFTYLYGGNDSSPLRMGDSIKSGDLIGQVGVTPWFEEPEVYFSTWKDGAYIDPSSVPRD